MFGTHRSKLSKVAFRGAEEAFFPGALANDLATLKFCDWPKVNSSTDVSFAESASLPVGDAAGMLAGEVGIVDCVADALRRKPVLSTAGGASAIASSTSWRVFTYCS